MQQDDDIRKVVDVNRVTRLAKDSGRFALIEPSSENLLLLTGIFILNMTPEQFWKVQCKLEAKELGIWYQLVDKKICEVKNVEQSDIDLYFEIVNHVGDYLEGTHLCQISATDSDIMLYSNGEQYVGVKRDYIEMFKDVPALRQIAPARPIAAADVHVIMPINTELSKYLRKL